MDKEQLIEYQKTMNELSEKIAKISIAQTEKTLKELIVLKKKLKLKDEETLKLIYQIYFDMQSMLTRITMKSVDLGLQTKLENPENDSFNFDEKE